MRRFLCYNSGRKGGGKMKLLFVSDSFKGSLSSSETAALLTKAAKEVFDSCTCMSLPVADGGEGTVEAVTAATHGKIITAEVHNPLMRRIKARYGVTGSKAVIEMAAASGLPLLSEKERDPLSATTYGTGELIMDALRRGCREIVVAIGGSATNDGGMGCVRALGGKFFDKDGRELSGCGRDLTAVYRIALDGLEPLLREAAITVLCDVKNPLCGASGATRTFSTQKGATPAVTEELEQGMCRYRDVIRRQFGTNCDAMEGAGAAGGLGAALRVFLGGKMRSGIETVLDLTGFDEALAQADLVVTGEGKTDAQSACGKVMAGVGRRAKKMGVPVVGLSGSLDEGAQLLYAHGINSLMTTVSRPMTLDEAMQNASALYYDAAVRLFRLIQTGMQIAKK